MRSPPTPSWRDSSAAATSPEGIPAKRLADGTFRKGHGAAIVRKRVGRRLTPARGTRPTRRDVMLLRLRVRLPDRPGSLGQVARPLGGTGADTVQMVVLERVDGRPLGGPGGVRYAAGPFGRAGLVPLAARGGESTEASLPTPAFRVTEIDRLAQLVRASALVLGVRLAQASAATAARTPVSWPVNV